MPPARPTEHPQVDPVDADLDLRVPTQRREWSTHRWVLPVIALGGILGASARYALELAWPSPDDGFAWATFSTNVSGSLLIGVLMVYVVEVGHAHPLVRPFLGVGVLGGFTTFSTYSVQTNTLLAEQRPGLAMTYMFGTLMAAMVAVTAGVFLARALRGLRRWLAHHREGSR
jgi:CrcB protein